MCRIYMFCKWRYIQGRLTVATHGRWLDDLPAGLPVDTLHLGSSHHVGPLGIVGGKSMRNFVHQCSRQHHCSAAVHGQGPLLASLSSYRFVAHSFAPILTLVCAEEAARAGLTIAGSPLVQGAGQLLFARVTRPGVQHARSKAAVYARYIVQVSSMLVPCTPDWHHSHPLLVVQGLYNRVWHRVGCPWS